jgi:hypothetical protein
MKRTLIRSTVIAATLALGGLALTATAAGANQASATTGTTAAATTDDMSAQSVVGYYDVVNTTSENLTVVAVHHGDFEGRPVEGTVIAPGQKLHFGVVLYVFQRDEGIFDMRIGDTDEYLRVTAEPAFADGVRQSHFLNDSGTYQLGVSGTWRDVLTVSGRAQTTRTIDASDRKAQLETFNRITAPGSVATGQFLPEARKSGLAEPVQASQVLENYGSKTAIQTHAWSAATLLTSHWDVATGLSASIKGVVDASVTATYGEMYTQESRVSRDLQVRVPAGQALWLTYAAPIDEVTGTYVVQLGNDTYYFTDMTFDVPVKDDGTKGTVGIQERPIGSPDIPANRQPVNG